MYTPPPKYTPPPEPPQPEPLTADATPMQKYAWTVGTRAHALWVLETRRGLLAEAISNLQAGRFPSEDLGNLLGLLCNIALEQVVRQMKQTPPIPLPPPDPAIVGTPFSRG